MKTVILSFIIGSFISLQASKASAVFSNATEPTSLSDIPTEVATKVPGSVMEAYQKLSIVFVFRLDRIQLTESANNTDFSELETSDKYSQATPLKTTFGILPSFAFRPDSNHYSESAACTDLSELGHIMSKNSVTPVIQDGTKVSFAFRPDRQKVAESAIATDLSELENPQYY